MLVEKEIQNILHQLSDGSNVEVSFEGATIMMRLINDASKLFLSTSVYRGGNYIPTSVRTCSSRKAPFYSSLHHTFITINEEQYQIHLNYVGDSTDLNNNEFKDIIERFGIVAEKWRFYLDEHDKNDLIYVRST